ncbi:MAG TPA: GAF domain-containing protein, partial [Deferrisomatales bacterium]|nr:GAF domain-containing protein [Deferrisomatales bacterium]
MPRESQKLILLEDISQIVVSAHDLQETLDQITGLLARRLRVEVCSIYLHRGGTLVLRSTCGLDQTAVGKVSMSAEEGLTGLAFQRAAPVNVRDAVQHPRYKFFPGIGEEAFHSYLGVPLIHRQQPIGALVVQTREPREFSTDTVRLLVTAASQLAAVIANARLLDDRAHAVEPEPTYAPPAEAFLRGIGVAPGVGQGTVYPLSEEMGLEAYPAPDAAPPEVER